MQIKHDSYDDYKKAQTETNKRKLDMIWVREDTIQKIKNISDELGINVKSVLCHGTRNGAEQKYFKKYFNCSVVGTEISDTATQFENTIQWDFHDIKDDWIGAFDIIYSNSWDHAYNFELALNNWVKCLNDGGRVVIEFTREHQKATDKADCFGLSKFELVDFIENRCGHIIELFIDVKVESYHCPTTELVFIKRKVAGS